MNYAHIPAPVMQALCYAMFHSIWQGLLLFGVLHISFRIFSKLSASFRYVLAYSSSVLLLASFIYCFFTHLPYRTSSLSTQRINTTEYFQVTTTHTPATTPTISEQTIQWLITAAPFLTYFYLLGIIILTLRVISGMAGLKRLQQQNVAPPSKMMMAMTEHVCSMLSITTPVKLLLSAKVDVPVVFGYLKPVLLLPAAMISNLSNEQLEALIIHELAHIKRHDYLLNIFLVIIETLLFFNPFSWLISAMIRKEREHCCDDIVVTLSEQPLPYAQALALLESYKLSNRLTLAANGNKHHLFHRIKRITTMKKQHINRTQIFASVSLLLVLCFAITYLTPAIAQSQKEKKNPNRKSTTITTKKERITIIDDDGNVRTYHSMDEVPDKDKKLLPAFKDELNEDGTTTTTVTADSITLIPNMDDEESINVKDLVTKAMGSVNIQVNGADIAIAEVDKALKEINLDDVDRELKKSTIIIRQSDKAMKDADKALKEADKALKEIDWVNIQKAVDEGFKNAKIEITTGGKNKQMVIVNNKGRGTKTSTTTLPVVSYDKMLTSMEQDGLIMREEGFSIKKEGNKLFINGKEQSNEVLNKYRSYLKAEKMTIKGDEENMNVHIMN